MNKQIFIINGSGGCGKDTFVNYVSKHVPTINYSSVFKVKSIAKMIGWNGEKSERDRKFLSDLKKLTSDYCDMPFEDMKLVVDKFERTYHEFLFLHIREPKEIERAKNAFNAKTILIRRDSVKKIESNMSDKNVEDYKYDYYIENSGTLDDLEKSAIKFIDNIKTKLQEVKKKLFIDVDNTLLDSIKAIVDLYNEDFSAYPKYKFVHPYQIDSYDFKELPLINKQYIDHYFCQPRFFEKVEFMDNAEEVIEKLKTKYDITFVSMGNYANLKLKERWIEEHIHDTHFIGVSFEVSKDKSVVDMSDGILIDDSYEMLVSSNADVKICFGDFYEWNNQETEKPYLRLMNWKDVERFLMKDDIGGDL